jgi:YHS domain-containing protein/thioredoxin-related protein
MPAHFARHVARSGPLALSGCLIILATTLPTPSSAAEGRGIAWKTDFAAAQAEAKAKNLPLWIQFTGPWCIFCRKMDANAFIDPGIVARANERFVAVKIRSDSYENLVAQFGITSLPSTVVLSPSGRTILAQSRGYSDPYEFAAILDGAWANALVDPGILAMNGYCPVRLVEGKGRVKGDHRLAVFHDGHAYRFADAKAREAFLADTEKYLPSAGGLCVVTKKDKALDLPGDAACGATYHGRLYLFSTLDARAKFAASPDSYSGLDIADNGLCPHCKTVAKAEVAGKPEFAATHSGKRYLFPDESHRQAFREAPDRYVR